MVVEVRILLSFIFLSIIFQVPAQVRLSEDFTNAINPSWKWENRQLIGVSSQDMWRFDDPYLLDSQSSSSGIFATFAGFSIPMTIYWKKQNLL